MVDEYHKKKIQKMKVKSMARRFDESSIDTLGGFATNAQLEPHIRIEAIKVLLDRGHGRPKAPKEKTEHSGTVNLTLRHIHEGKPPGEK